MKTKQRILTPPRIGQYWQGQGGVLAALMRGENGQPDYYLIVPADKTKLPKPAKWATDETEVKGANSTLDGLANTTALLKLKGKHPAAMSAAAFTCDGHSDFYLPARSEARAIWANTPELLPDNLMHTSTQYSAHNAWYQNQNGYQNWNYKYDEGAVLPVRRLLFIE